MNNFEYQNRYQAQNQGQSIVQRTHASMKAAVAFILTVLVPVLATALMLFSTSSNARNSDMALFDIEQISLEGDTLYPEYGITREFLFERINQVYSLMEGKLTMTDIGKIADALTLAYREKGLTFNQTIIVPQEVKDADLTLYVLKGTLADIEIVNNSLYTKAQLMEPFRKLIGKTIYEPNIMLAVNQANSKPGVNIFAYFSTGMKHGEALLNLRVMNEEKHSTSVTLDNKGVEQTGATRITATHTINNPFKNSGQVKSSLLLTSESGNIFGGFAYSRPFSNTGLMGFSVLRSDFSVSGQFSNLGLKGDFTSLSGYWSNKPAVRSASRLQHTSSVSLATKRSVVTSQEFNETFEKKSNYIIFSGAYEIQYLDSFAIKGQHTLFIHPALSNVTTADDDTLPNNFVLLRTTYQYRNHSWTDSKERPTPFQLLVKNQWTTENLPAPEKFATTGSGVNRGFAPGIFSGDLGLSISVEQSIKTSIEALKYLEPLALRPFVFMDYSYGKSLGDESFDANFFSIGLGLKTKFTPTKPSAGNPTDTKPYFSSGAASITLGYPVSYSSNILTDAGLTFLAKISFDL